MGRKKKDTSHLLTETELVIMNCLWELKQATVHEIIAALGNEKDYAYNTVSTIVRILEQKEYVTNQKIGRSHHYSAKIEKNYYESIGLNSVVDNLFNGAPINLMKRMLGDSNLSKNEINELKKLIKDL